MSSEAYKRAKDTWCQACFSCFGGLIVGGGVASIAWSIADLAGMPWIGDVIVSVTLFISCLMPCISFKMDEEELNLPECCGLCCGIGSILTLIIVHLSLRFTSYEDIQSSTDIEDNLDPIVWVIVIGVIIMIIEMILFCYCDYRKAMKDNPDYVEQLNESDYYQ